MKEIKKKLDHCFAQYETLQAAHIQIMRNESMPDLLAMTEQRDAAFIRLKDQLNHFVEITGGGEDSLPILTDYQTRLTSIMTVSNELAVIIEGYKGQLKTSLKQMQQGKAAMRGYKAANMNY